MISGIKKIKTFLPLMIFCLIALFLWVGLKINPHDIPSPLIDKPFPTFNAPGLQNQSENITENNFIGKITLLNVFATWCYSCRAEHSVLMDINNKFQINIVGLDYKDDRNKAKQWIEEYGNPYQQIIYDPKGKLALNLGVYGTPESYIIDQKGIIRYKQIGPMSPDDWREKVLPVINRLRRIS